MADGVNNHRHTQANKMLSPLQRTKSLRPFSNGAAKGCPLDEWQGSGGLNLHFQMTLSLLREANSAQVIFYWFLVPGSPVFPESLRKRGKLFSRGFCFSALFFFLGEGGW